jgi:hypothetical protein
MSPSPACRRSADIRECGEKPTAKAGGSPLSRSAAGINYQFARYLAAALANRPVRRSLNLRNAGAAAMPVVGNMDVSSYSQTPVAGQLAAALFQFCRSRAWRTEGCGPRKSAAMPAQVPFLGGRHRVDCRRRLLYPVAGSLSPTIESIDVST